MSLRSLEFKTSYNSGYNDSDIVNEFFVPALGEAIRYDRAAGYFSSRVFASAARGIAGLVRRGGKMRLITSHAFTPKDIINLQNHFESEELASSLISEFTTGFDELGSLAGSIARNHVAAMCWMLREGYLEVKVVVPMAADLTLLTPEEIDKFHPKFGIFYDEEENKVAFSGSINETESAWRKNIENFDVYESWVPGRDDYISPKITRFEEYWNGSLAGKWKTIDLPVAVRDRIISEYASDEFPDLPEFAVEIKKEGLRSYQKNAVDSWVTAGRRGILEMATGTGKTRTANACIKSSQDEGKLLTVIVVPYQHIGDQWAKELSDLNPMFVDGDWRRKLSNALLEVSLGRTEHLTLVAVKNTASKSDFVEMLKAASGDFSHTLLVGDEVHWLGAKTYQPALLSFADWRLGLSATPRRYFDDDGTDVLMNYFERTVYELPIKAALLIKDEAGRPILCPYIYKPILVGLSQDEINLYQEFSQKIARLRNSKDVENREDQLESLYIQRSLIAKSAESKIPAVRELLESLPKPLEQCLIYCADFNQLNEVARILQELKIDSQQITGKESATASVRFKNKSEREYIIENFAKGQLGVLLAIDCLDEGVDIPSAQTGIILASSGNVKEFIQRRGRLMRPFKGKENAIIYDLCVLPEDSTDPLSSLNVVDVELRRIIEFGDDALNREEVISYIETKRRSGQVRV